MTHRPLAVVTGASSGIGAATVRRLAASGFLVVAAARRIERLRALAEDVADVVAVQADVTDSASVSALRDVVADLHEGGSTLRVLVNNAGGALGADRVASADPEDWLRMYDVNVVGSLRVTQALLPFLETSGAGQIVNMTSTAAHGAYEGGGGYCGAKAALHMMNDALRLELNGHPVRITEVAPGMVKTEEFSLVRFDGDREKADRVYTGVAKPLTAEDVADAIVFAATRADHVDVDLMVLRPLAQASATKVHRA